MYVRLAAHQRANLRRFDFTDDDFAEVSDHLVDALVAYRGEQSIAGRVRAQFDAGADHVCVQVLTPGNRFPLPEWRSLAKVVL